MGRKRKVVSQDSSALLHLPPCRVCEGPGGGFHYGVNTCEACKGFFHRSSKIHDEFECKGQGSCLIIHTDPKICKKCRYEKCLKVGMAKKAIKTGRYTVQKRTNDTLEIIRLKKSKTTQLSPPSRSSCSASESSVEALPTLSPLSDLSCRNMTSNATQMHRSEIYQNSDGSQWDTSSSHRTDQSDARSPCSISSSDSSRYNQSTPLSFNFTLPSPSPQMDHFSPDTGHDTSVSSTSLTSTFSAEQTLPNLFSSFLHWDSQKTLSELSGEDVEMYRLYQDADMVVKIIDQAKEAHINFLLPTISKQELKEKAAEHIESCRLKAEMFGPMHRLPDQEYDQIYASTGLDADGRQLRLETISRLIEIHVRAISKFAKCIPGFKGLHIQDQVTLIKYSRSEMLFVCHYNLVDMETCVIMCGDKRLRCKRDISLDINNDEIVDRYIDICKVYDKLCLTREEKLLLAAIIIMSPDRARVIRSRKVWLMYELLNKCLIDLFQLRCKRPFQLWAKVISFMSELRTFTHFCSSTIKQLRMDKYTNALNNPLLREMLGGLYFDTDNDESEDLTALPFDGHMSCLQL